MEDLAELEGATRGRLQAQEGGLLDLDRKELVFGRPGHTFNNAAFTYTRPGGNRFNDDERGAWYCAFQAETVLAEVTFHLTKELVAIHRFENVTDYAELLADFVGQFHDLRDDAFSTDESLTADPTIAKSSKLEMNPGASKTVLKAKAEDTHQPHLAYPLQPRPAPGRPSADRIQGSKLDK